MLQWFVKLHIPWSHGSENVSKEMKAALNNLHE